MEGKIWERGLGDVVLPVRRGEMLRWVGEGRGRARLCSRIPGRAAQAAGGVGGGFSHPRTGRTHFPGRMLRTRPRRETARHFLRRQRLGIFPGKSRFSPVPQQPLAVSKPPSLESAINTKSCFSSPTSPRFTGAAGRAGRVGAPRLWDGGVPPCAAQLLAGSAITSPERRGRLGRCVHPCVALPR